MAKLSPLLIMIGDGYDIRANECPLKKRKA